MQASHDKNRDFGGLKVLGVDSSPRREGSVSRGVADALIERLEVSVGAVDLTVRDHAVESPSFVDAAWVDANFASPQQRSADQSAALAESDALVTELKAADMLVIGVPICNVGIPAKLKAWIDMIARARLTFRCTENGPVGLLKGKPAYLVVASGGTAVGSEIDFATGYLGMCSDFWGSRMSTSWPA